MIWAIRRKELLPGEVINLLLSLELPVNQESSIKAMQAEGLSLDNHNLKRYSTRFLAIDILCVEKDYSHTYKPKACPYGRSMVLREPLIYKPKACPHIPNLARLNI